MIRIRARPLHPHHAVPGDLARPAAAHCMIARALVEDLGVDQVPAEPVLLDHGASHFVVGAGVHGERLRGVVLTSAAVGADPDDDFDVRVLWVLVLPCVRLVVEWLGDERGLGFQGMGEDKKEVCDAHCGLLFQAI